MRLIFAVIIALPTCTEVLCQERKIIGRVLDFESQKPIKNANIVIGGTTSGTISNHLGFFELTLDTSQHKLLVVSHVGYKNSEILVPKEERFKLFLEKDYTFLKRVNLSLYPRNPKTIYQKKVEPIPPDSELIIVESTAAFPGGISDFYEYIGNSLVSQLKNIPRDGFAIEFTINEKGQAVSVKVSDSTKLVNTAVVKVLQEMPSWKPATQRSHNVPQHFVLTIVNFETPENKSEVFEPVYDFLSRTISYPFQARRMGIEGVVFVNFALDNSGNLVKTNVAKDIGAECGEEVRRAVAIMPIELTRHLIDQTGHSSFILPVAFGLARPYKQVYSISSNDAYVLSEIAVTAVVKKREVLTTGNAQSSPVINMVQHSPYMYTTLKEALKSPKNVRRLSIIKNYLTSFPGEILGLKNLEFLDLEMNKLRTLPAGIDSLTKLEELYLFENNIQELPANFRNLERLKVLGLASNQLNSFPEELSSLESLEALDLSDNALSLIPPEIGNIKNLRVLVLRNNHIKSIPQELYALKKLEKIDLQGNPLNAEVIEQMKILFKKVEILF